MIHRVVGRGTTPPLARLVPGDKLSLIGPLGIGFSKPPELELACLVGGGVGIPPLLYMAKMLAMKRCKYVVAFLGAQRGDLLPVTLVGPPPSREGDPLFSVQELTTYDSPAVITTDDGSIGMKGYVTQALRRFLDQRQAALGPLQNAVVYCCGPTPMMKATGRVAAEFNVPCQGQSRTTHGLRHGHLPILHHQILPPYRRRGSRMEIQTHLHRWAGLRYARHCLVSCGISRRHANTTKKTSINF